MPSTPRLTAPMPLPPPPASHESIPTANMPRNKQPRAKAVQHDLPDDCISAIASYLVDPEGPNPLYDEADIAKQAAQLLLVGNPLFTTLGTALAESLSPAHLSELTVPEKATAAQLKAICKVRWPGGGAPPITAPT